MPDQDVVWSSERWVLTGPDEPTGLPFVAMLLPRAHLDLGELDDLHAGELGQLLVRLDRAARALPAVSRLHVNKWGDGGAHLHVFLLGRPAGRPDAAARLEPRALGGDAAPGARRGVGRGTTARRGRARRVGWAGARIGRERNGHPVAVPAGVGLRAASTAAVM